MKNERKKQRFEDFLSHGYKKFPTKTKKGKMIKVLQRNNHFWHSIEPEEWRHREKTSFYFVSRENHPKENCIACILNELKTVKVSTQ